MSNAFYPLNTEIINDLFAIVGESYVSMKDTDLDQHARDQSFHPAHRPAAVVWPKSVEEISALLMIANDHRIPVTPWGAGTSLEGNPIPVQGGIVVDLMRMDKILEVDMDDSLVVVQAGARYQDMNAALGRKGLFFAPDPGANASIGGMIANNASGTRTLRYGATKDNVLQLEVVLPTGEIIRTGTRSTKTSSGYDLLHLFIGSEGTLGIVTEATLKLAPLPEKFSAIIASFPETQNATRTVSNIIISGITPAALEFLDETTIRTLNASGEFNLLESPTLLLEFHSATDASLESELSIVERLCKEEGCMNFESGLGRGERDRLWHVQ
jgi:D-lactate dehydrogenase (cytochrome)